MELLSGAVQAAPAFPVLTAARAVCRLCLLSHGGELPHVVECVDAFLGALASKNLKSCYQLTHSLRAMQYVAARESGVQMDPFYRRWVFNDAVALVAANGDLGTLQWLVESYLPDEFLTKAVYYAAENGHLHLLEWLWEHHRDIGYWGGTELEGAILNGHVNVVKWLRVHAAPHPDSAPVALRAAAEMGDMALVQWLHDTHHGSASSVGVRLRDRVWTF
ncbi:hypothetical protein BBJ28_00019828 [Nothophytophthora sp. Chile5]|nr:hypothetical protein BBJ28_00019828 [Nothophytophthora sp. Chile5]